MQPQPGTDVRVNVLGVGISALNLTSATAAIERAAATPGFAGYVTVTGVHGVVESQADEALQRIHNRSFLTTPDGMPMVWLGRLAGHRQMDRVYGPDLMERLPGHPVAAGWRPYFFGGAEGWAGGLVGGVSVLRRPPKGTGVGSGFS